MSLADWFLPAEGRLSSNDFAPLGTLARSLPPDTSAALLAPSRAERRGLSRFDAARGGERYDVLVAGRLPGFVSDGSPQFRAALRRCRLLVVLDATPPADSQPAASARLLERARLGDSELRFYRGELTDPLLRVDDYPTGVRPILADLSLLHEALQLIDDSGLEFHLGIVPALVEDRMEGFLKGLRHLVVSMHGFEHGYARLSQRLLDAGDPFNQRGTVGGFDEFADASYEQILATLERGRSLLESRTGQRAISYIPPTNLGNRRTGRALEALGFEYVLSERPVPGCQLPCVASDFYDRSSKLEPAQRPTVASLHATWEADLLRDGDRASLPRFLAALLEQRRRGRERATQLAGRLALELTRG